MFVFDNVEMIRRAAQHNSLSFHLVAKLSGLKIPFFAETIMPFGILFAAIYTCWRLNKTNELIVIRAAGISAWQFLAPMVFCALLTGAVTTTVINPVAAMMLIRYDRLATTYLGDDSDLVTVSQTGIWLRQPTADGGYALLHSETFDQKEWRMSSVIVLYFDAHNNFLRRVDCPEAFLKDGYWELRQVLLNSPHKAERAAVQKLPTELTAKKIEESFADPESISFWNISEYISVMEETGFPATTLHIHFQALLAEPLLLVAMVLLAATFSLRPPRFGGTAIMITLGVGIGFFIFFMESMLHAYGASQKIPVYLAAWTPAAVSLLLGVTALLHLEDG
jgi:lipopolysaccharide export system permease protein